MIKSAYPEKFYEQDKNPYYAVNESKISEQNVLGQYELCGFILAHQSSRDDCTHQEADVSQPNKVAILP